MGRTPRPTGPATLAILALLLAAAPAAAQTSRPDGAAEDGRASEPPRGILAGPEVAESEKGQGRSFLEVRRDRARTGAGAARRWLRLVGELDLTGTQRTEVRAAVAAFTRERRAFQREHGAEMQALQRELRAARAGERDRPREKAERLRQLRSMAPQPDAVQERIWALLTPAQRSALQAALARDEPASELDEPAQRRLRFLLERKGDRSIFPGQEK